MLVKVVKIPAGPAPKVVRKQWVGVVLEASEADLQQGFESNFLTGEKIPPRRAYKVEVLHALEQLEKASQAAADWFRENLPQDLLYLGFGADEVQVIQNEGL